MDKLLISGGNRLEGDVRISGAKNSALPLLAGTILASTPVSLDNVPDLHDIKTMIRILQNMGMTIERQADGKVLINANTLDKPVAPYELVKTMRASIFVLGSLVTRFKEAYVSLPGGCAIGSRPIDLHLDAMKALGAEIELRDGYVFAKADPKTKRLKGGTVLFEKTTVGGTQNLMMAATLADGTTIIENAAKEPENVDLANYLNKMGAQITGQGTSVIKIVGVEKLTPARHSIIPDRIETGTFLCAVGAAGGDVMLRKANADHLESVIEKLREAGVSIESGDDWIRVKADARPKAVGFRTREYPAFPTDMQAQFMALNCIAQGTATVTETIFENRFMHVNELVRLGAKIQVDGKVAVITGAGRGIGQAIALGLAVATSPSPSRSHCTAAPAMNELPSRA